MQRKYIPEVIALVNRFYALEGSDYTGNESVVAAIGFCNDRVRALTGKTVLELPSYMNDLICELNEMSKKCKQ